MSDVAAAIAQTRERMQHVFTPNQVLGRTRAIGCVAVEITQRCNLDCTLCYLSEHSEDVEDIPMEIILKRLKEVRQQYGAGTNVQITGGDPTLRKHYELIEIVQYARPTTGLFLSRHGGYQDSDNSIIGRAIGKWHFTSFLNQLRGRNQAIDNPLFWGARFTFRPYQNLDIGLSRTAIWGGKKQPQKLETFTNVVLGNQKEASNQFTALDIRYGFRLSSLTAAVYAQALNQKQSKDELSTTKPKATIGMAGMELSFAGRKTHNRFVLEAINTTANFYRGIAQNDTAYEDSLYDQGYRYFGRSLGASNDNDSEVVSLRGQHYLANGHSLQWQWHHANLNHDQTEKNNQYAFKSEGQSITVTSLHYRRPINDRLNMTLSGQHINGRLYQQNRRIKSSVGLSLSHHW